MTEGVTLVNGQDAAEGSVQIGKQTDAPDVPIVEYQYAPVELEKDPDITVVLSDQDISEPELRIRQLSDIHRSISENGVNYESVVALENIIPGIITNNFPELGYTHELSQQSLNITLERIDSAKLGGIVALIGVIIAGIIALFKKFTDKTERAKDKVLGTPELQQLETTVSEKVPSIQEKAKLTEAEIRRNVEASKWLIDNKIIDIIQLHGRLAPDLNVEAVVKDLPAYLKQLGYGDPTRNTLFNISNIIGANMPNIFYETHLADKLAVYETFLKEFPLHIRKRLDSISALNNAYAQVKYGKPFEYTRREEIMINAIKKFTGATNYNSEAEAVADLQDRIKNDWGVRDRQSDLTRLHVSQVISTKIKPIIISIINSKGDLEREFDNLEKFRKKDMAITASMLQNTRNELDKLLNASYSSEETKKNCREGFVKLQQAPELYKEEFNVMNKLAAAAMSPIINVSSTVLAMHTRVNMYYDLIDRLTSILRRFEKEFGEDIK